MVEFYFFDTSAIVKRYFDEDGSALVKEMVARQPTVRVVLSRITWVEILSALSRLQREGTITADIFDRQVRVLRQHFKLEYQIAEFDQTVSSLAGELVRRHPLRAYDAVQLASVLHLRNVYRSAGTAKFTFISADRRLIDVALEEDLEVVNPLNQAQDK